MLLNRIVQRRLILNVARIHVRPPADEVRAQRHRLHRIDQTGAAIEVGLLDVGAILDQAHHHIQMGHEAGAAHRRRSRVRWCVQRRAEPYETLDDRQFAGHAGAPERRHPVHRAVLGHLEHALLLDVRVAHTNQVFGDVHIAAFAGDKQRGAAVAHDLDDVAAGFAGQTGCENALVKERIINLIKIPSINHQK